ncbi:acyl carrier protein [Actinopolymorpha alba]|uniref:acyl carrier protein n=1 Tax=Actinopolymorpha alba TaxID=533267 RepID=UPI000366FD71|nr:phosphopantetheine-binding protein [Actinopolymorpha alba]
MNVSIEEATPKVVFEEITRMLRKVLAEYDVDDLEITRTSTFQGDLEMESIDLVTLAGELEQRYGRRVNFAEFIADLDLEQIIALNVGSLVDYVAVSLNSGSDQPAGG